MSKKSTPPFTMVPNPVLYSKDLTVYDKIIFAWILSCNPSFPSYEKLGEWSGISRDTVWKCLRHLEKKGFISRRRGGKKIYYVPYCISPPHGLNQLESVCFTDSISPPHGLTSVRPTDPINTNLSILKNKRENENAKRAKAPLGKEDWDKRKSELINQVLQGKEIK